MRKIPGINLHSQTTLNKAQLTRRCGVSVRSKTSAVLQSELIWDRGSLAIWESRLFVSISNSLNSQTRHLSTNCAFSSLLAPENGKSQKVEAFQHSQHPREERGPPHLSPFRLPLEQKGLALELLDVNQRQRMRKLRRSQNWSSAVSTISRSDDVEVSTLISLYLSQSHLNTQQLKSAIQLIFKAIFFQKVNVQEMGGIALQWRFVVKTVFLQKLFLGLFSFWSLFQLSRFLPRHRACRRSAQRQSHETCQNHAPWG